MANFGQLTAENGAGVWDTPANFKGFCVLAALLHGTSVRQPNFAALNRRRHLYSAVRPSRWALAHILVLLFSLLASYKELVECSHCSASANSGAGPTSGKATFWLFWTFSYNRHHCPLKHLYKGTAKQRRVTEKAINSQTLVSPAIWGTGARASSTSNNLTFQFTLEPHKVCQRLLCGCLSNCV